MNSEFIKAEQERFQEAHPAADGWACHEAPPAVGQPIMSQLPAFLRATLPAGAWQERMITEIGYQNVGNTLSRLSGTPYRRRGRRGLTESAWQGELRFEWKGTPIHILRVHADIGSKGPHLTCLVLVASKSWEALDDLYRRVNAFISRGQSRDKTIWVVNGPNIPRGKSTWEDLVLPPAMKNDIRSSTEAFFKSKARYKELGIPWKRGFLLAGPPGNGKTLLTKVLASQYRVGVITMAIKSEVEESTLDYAFAMAASYAPSILLLEDLDKLLKGTRVNMSYLLNKLDGIEEQKGILVIATTNEPERLDPALLHRPSRFDRVWRFDLPGEPERRLLLGAKGSRFFSPKELDAAARSTQGFSMAYVQETVVNALSIALTAGVEPSDSHLEESVRLLRAQMRGAAAPSPVMGGAPVAIGFNGYAKETL